MKENKVAVAMKSQEEQTYDRYETTLRMDPELARRLHLICQVIDESKNSLINAAVKQLVMDYENDPEFKKQRAAMLKQWSGSED